LAGPARYSQVHPGRCHVSLSPRPGPMFIQRVAARARRSRAFLWADAGSNSASITLRRRCAKRSGQCPGWPSPALPSMTVSWSS
jgi:hypothetical protein